jgi:sirohydrochlorin cobaltochelatase
MGLLAWSIFCRNQGVIPMSTPQSALVLFAHGSRDPKWAEPFKAIQALIRAQAPDVPVELAFLELMQPGIQECLIELANKGVKRVSIVPVFLAAGRHLREDLPTLIAPIQKQFPDLVINVTAPIGDIPEFQAAIARLALAQANL